MNKQQAIKFLERVGIWVKDGKIAKADVAKAEKILLKEQIPGGLSSGKSPKDFDQKELLMGINVEVEHTDDVLMAMEIAMDHLSERPDYYTELKKVESDYNPMGMKQDYGWGNEDLNQPIHHKEGRLISFTNSVPRSTTPDNIIKWAKELITKAENAKERRSDLAVFDRGDDIGVTFYDTDDTHEEYQKFLKDFVEKNGRNPYPKEIKY